jgi:hypothetical protein
VREGGPRPRASHRQSAQRIIYFSVFASIETVADAITAAREGALPGRECVAVSDTLWYFRRALLFRRSCPMRPKKKLDRNVVLIAPQGEKHEFCQIEVERGIVTAFRKEALARGTSADRLIRNVLDLVVSDKLIGAVIDD